MDYEKKYKEALEIAKMINSGECVAIPNGWTTMELIFPELRESEDERTRKELIVEIKSWEGIPESKRRDYIAYLEKQKDSEDKGEISDGYHTFNELYYYRMLYNAAFFNLLPKEWVHKSKRHHDREECFGGGWFIVMANLPTGQISNHYELKDWDLFQIPEKEIADEWDGHTPQEAAERIHEYLLEEQQKQKPAEWGRQSIINALTEWLTEKIAPLHKKSSDGTITKREQLFRAVLLETRSLINSPDFQFGENTPTGWSEEDEKMREHIISDLREFRDCETDEELVSDYEDEIAWLKSLRPSWNPAWRIWRNGACGNSEGNPIALVKTYGGYELVSCLGADGEKYIMLSDLEKLPGFNEK